jgi:mRNA-degrading endonuclease toxin of MazEF toxin-antitoxin module
MKEIWYIKIWINVWREIFWKKDFFRPVLVVSRIGNMFFCLPLTTKWKCSEFYIKLFSVYNKKDSYIVVNQWRVFDVQRFFTKVTQVSLQEFEQIKKLLRYRYFPEVLRIFPPE